MVPHEESFVRNALAICERLGTNMIVDEVWSGVHHFGPFFMTEMYGIAPHFIVLAKSLGGGISKLAAVLARRDVALRTEEGRATYFLMLICDVNFWQGEFLAHYEGVAIPLQVTFIHPYIL